MRSKIKLSFGACVLSALAILFMQPREESSMTSVLMENVEALAVGEGYNHIYCIGDGSVDCPETHVRVMIYETFSLPLEKY